MSEMLMRWDGTKLVPVVRVQRLENVIANEQGGLLNQPKTDTSLPSFIPTTSKTINALNGLHNDYYYEITGGLHPVQNWNDGNDYYYEITDV